MPIYGSLTLKGILLFVKKKTKLTGDASNALAYGKFDENESTAAEREYGRRKGERMATLLIGFCPEQSRVLYSCGPKVTVDCNVIYLDTRLGEMHVAQPN